MEGIEIGRVWALCGSVPKWDWFQNGKDVVKSGFVGILREARVAVPKWDVFSFESGVRLVAVTVHEQTRREGVPVWHLK